MDIYLIRNLLPFMLGISLAVTACSSETASLVVDPPQPTIRSTPISSGEIELIKQFAESYEPKSGREVIPSPPVLDKKLSEILAKAAASGSREHEKYIVLIFLKLSRFQIEHFNQRYELGRDNPLTREFYRIIGRQDFEKAEMMNAYLSDTYVKENPGLLEYVPIKSEMDRIEKEGERIKQKLLETEMKQSKSLPKK